MHAIMRLPPGGMPIFIVEDHDEVLQHLYKGIGAKWLPFSGLQLVHFDSHPDLNIPQGIDANDVFCKEKLFESLSIENWIIPAIYAGHFDTVVWVKCEWAKDIEDGTLVFHVGRHRKTGKLRVTCPITHFVSELSYASHDDLENAKEVTLHVVTWSRSGSDESSLAHLIAAVRQPYVLDVDMDFFSTRNPLKDLYNERQLTLLASLYYCGPISVTADSHGEAAAATTRRAALLHGLHLGLTVEGSTSKEDVCLLDADKQRWLAELLDECRQLQRCREEDGAVSTTAVDYEMMHEHGCTFDLCGLPHHVSSSEEIAELMTAFAQCLHRLPVPAAVTAARSSQDDYCPKDQVESIQEKLIGVFTEVYPRCRVYKTYESQTQQ